MGDNNDESSIAGLVTGYLDGSLGEKSALRLTDGLKSRPAVREVFVRTARVHGLLTERAVSIETTGTEADPAGESLDDATILPAIVDYSSAEVEQDEFGTRIWEEPRRQSATKHLRDFLRDHPGRSGGIAAAVLLAISPILWLTNRPVGVTAPPQAVVMPVSPVLPKSTATLALPTVVVAETVGAKNSDGEKLVRGTLPAGPVALASGWVRLDFNTGVTVVVEGPARFEVTSPTELKLTSGRVSAEVPQAGHGFTVQAPFCRVVDLGTEFGVSVAPDGKNDVEVFKGKVSLDRSGNSDVMVQGQGRQIDSIDAPAVNTTAEPRLFVRREQLDRWSRIETQGDLATAAEQSQSFTEQLSRDPALALYFAFDDRDTSPKMLRNRAASTLGKFDMPIGNTPPIWCDGRLPGMSALDFNPALEQRLLLRSYPMTNTGELSCATWVYARSRVQWGTIAKSWGNTISGAFHLGLSGTSNSLEVELDGSIPGGPVVAETSSNPFPLNRWVHVAFTSDGTTLRLYRDGKEVASGPSRPIAAWQPIKTISIGAKTGDDGANPSLGPQVGYWDGKIGEFALFHRALSASEIGRLSNAVNN